MTGFIVPWPSIMRKALKAILRELTVAGIIISLFAWLASGASQHPQLKIGSSYMTMNNPFYQVINDEIAKQVEQKGDLLSNRDPGLDVNRQIEQIHAFMRSGVRVIILNPVDGQNKQLLQALQAAKRAGIKLVVVDSQLANKQLADTTIISANYHAGELCAKHLLRQRQSAKILLLDHYGALSARDRITGFLATLRRAPHPRRYQIINHLNTWGQAEVTLPVVKRLLTHGLKFNTIMAINDQIAVGALAALDAKSVTQQVDVYSVDGSSNMKQLIKTNHDAIATAAQAPQKLGQQAITAAYRLLAGKSVPRRIVIPVTLITKRNQHLYNISGWHYGSIF